MIKLPNGNARYDCTEEVLAALGGANIVRSMLGGAREHLSLGVDGDPGAHAHLLKAKEVAVRLYRRIEWALSKFEGVDALNTEADPANVVPWGYGWVWDSCGGAAVGQLAVTKTPEATVHLSNVCARGPVALYTTPPALAHGEPEGWLYRPANDPNAIEKFCASRVTKCTANVYRPVYADPPASEAAEALSDLIHAVADALNPLARLIADKGEGPMAQHDLIGNLRRALKEAQTVTARLKSAPAPSALTKAGEDEAELEMLRVALVDAVYRMHSTPLHMLPRGIGMTFGPSIGSDSNDSFGVIFRSADGSKQEVRVTRALLDAVTAALDAEDFRCAALTTGGSDVG